MDNNQNTESNTFNRKFTVSFLFTDRDVGAIIGKNGTKIRETKFQSGCQLVFHGKMGGERILSITGRMDKLPLAVSMVAETLLREPTTSRDLDETGEFERNVVLLLILPQNTCGAVIGKEGSVVKGIMNSTGANILVFFEKSARSEIGGIAKIQGSPQKIRDAVIKIAEVIKSFFPGVMENSDGDSPVSPKIPGSNTSTLSGMSHKTSQTLYIDNRIARIVVGRGGSTISELRKISKAYIQVSNTDNRNESSLVISGDPSSVAVALHLIELKIFSKFPDIENWSDIRGGYYSRSNYNSRKTYNRGSWNRNNNSTRDTSNRGSNSEVVVTPD